MHKNPKIALFCLVVTLFFSGQAIADYTASSVEDIYNILDPVDDPETISGSVIINGQTVSWVADNPYAHYYVNGEYVGTYDDTGWDTRTPEEDYEEGMRIGRLIAKALFSTSLANPSSPASAAAKTSELIFNRVVMPKAQSRKVKENSAAQKAMHMTRTIGGQLRYANVDQDDSNGDVIGCNIGMAHDFENITIGGIVPYDYLDFDNLFDANRAGLMLFAQYFHDLRPDLSVTFTGNVHYIYTDIDYEFGGNDEINTFGGGLSTALTLDKDAYVASMALSYQYNKEDIDSIDDYSHLIKIGANAGYRIGQNFVVTLFGVWNKDITDYKNSSQDDDFFDLGTETTMNLSDTISMTVGYKKVVGLDNYDSDEIYLGSVLRF